MDARGTRRSVLSHELSPSLSPATLLDTVGGPNATSYRYQPKSPKSPFASHDFSDFFPSKVSISKRIFRLNSPYPTKLLQELNNLKLQARPQLPSARPRLLLYMLISSLTMNN
ncbi:hypothetical protein M378DRAFT_15787 [Amanita muscaria Koide BX008]|uniref:Uncharacterized protein n=1 Tax=Amanita muscaria (strain Koide BX008) TaxID=946122 RepID=A0A0C2WN20_AMAMK|nr:hypothetical protein M378DRAFT_15787 [Amanita muscaria Koide BX008]